MLTCDWPSMPTRARCIRVSASASGGLSVQEQSASSRRSACNAAAAAVLRGQRSAAASSSTAAARTPTLRRCAWDRVRVRVRGGNRAVAEARVAVAAMRGEREVRVGADRLGTGGASGVIRDRGRRPSARRTGRTEETICATKHDRCVRVVSHVRCATCRCVSSGR